VPYDRKDNPNFESLSVAGARLLRRFTELTEADQLHLYSTIREYLAAQDRDSVPDPELEARAGALKALQQACAHLHLDDPRQLGVKQFDKLDPEVRNGWTSQRVLKAFHTWNKAKDVAAGDRAWDTPRQRAIRKAAGAMRVKTDDYFEGVRLWLQTDPPNLSVTSYDDWCRERNRMTAGKELPYSQYRGIRVRYGIGWESILGIARGELTLDEATKLEAKPRHATGKGEHEFVTMREIVVITGKPSWALQEQLNQSSFPTPAVIKGDRRFWLRADVEAWANERPFPARQQNELGHLYVDHIEDEAILGTTKSMAGRTKGHPLPIFIGATRLWSRAEVEAHRDERAARSRTPNRTNRGRSHTSRASGGSD
jgi:predicted DNA-binding transcriptional regulator AlpA